MTDPRTTALAPHGHDAVAWVLHTLDPSEETAFVAHLEGCATCARTVAETSEVLAAIAGAVPQHDPPARVGRRLRAAVAAHPRDGVTDGSGAVAMPPSDVVAAAGPAGPGADEHGADEHGASEHRASEHRTGEHRTGEHRTDEHRAGEHRTDEHRAGEPGTVVPLARRRRTVRRALSVAAAAVLALVIVGLTVSNNQLAAERDRQAVAARQAGAVTAVLRDARDPGAVHATLAGPDGRLVGLVVDAGRGPEVVTTGLAPNRPDQIYVLWALAEGAPRPVGTFDVERREPAAHSVGSAGKAGAQVGFAVSLEPGRTAPASPTTIVASGQVGS